MIACNTATSIGADVAREVAAEHGVEVVPVVEPQAEIAAAITDSGRVGVLATPNTVESGAYRRALEAQGRALEVTEVEAPDLAPFIQEGSPFDEGVLEMARAYCAPLKRAEVDTLILGCTHYPLVAPMLQRILGRDVRLVSGGHAVAAAVQRTLESAGLARESGGEGDYRFLCTGEAESFRELGTRFLQMPLGDGRAGRAACRRLIVPTLRAMSSVLEQVQADVRTAMKAGEQGPCRRAADDRRLAAEGRQARRRRRGRGAPARAQEAARSRRGLPRRGPHRAGRRPRASRRS